MTFQDLKNKYMFSGTVTAGMTGGTSGSSFSSGTPPTQVNVPIPIVPGNTIAPLFDGPRYFADFKARLAALDPTKNAFCYLHGWWFHRTFSIDGQTATTNLLVDLLKARSAAGIDVRVIGWVAAPEVMNSALLATFGTGGMTNILNLNNQTMEFVRSLRREPTMADKAMCDILSHPGGAAHLKMCVMGDDLQATAYTGGIDMQMWRHNPQWHDVQAKVEGPGAQGVFDYFRDIWTEIKGRSVVSLVNPAPGGITLDSHTSGAPALAARSIGTATSGKIHVQCARTLPQFHFSSGALNSATIPTNQPLSFAPNGQLGIKEVWRKGISGGETYIYVEDQGFWSNEVGDWINAQIKAQPNLKVILLAGQSDPNDTANGVDVKMFIRMVNDHLLAGLTAAQIDRVCLAMHSAKTIHAKTTIIDEQWGLIGSANYMRRSLYTDLENSYGFMDEEGRAVGAYRLALWDFHFGAAEPDLTRAIARWFALPTAAPNAQQLKRQPLPMRAATFTAQEQTLIDTIEDVDSRNAWGDALLGLAASATGGGAISGP